MFKIKPGRYSLFSLLVLMSLSAAVIAITRFFVLHPRLLAPLYLLGLVITMLAAPSLVEHIPKVRERVIRGCCLLPGCYIFGALAYCLTVLAIRIAVFSN